MVSRNRKGSAAAAAPSTAGALRAARSRACCARIIACSAARCAWLARSVGFIVSPRCSYWASWASSGGLGLLGQRRVHRLPAAREHDAAHDLVLRGQLRRAGLLVPEGGQEGEQVPRVERGGRGGDAAGPV